VVVLFLVFAIVTYCGGESAIGGLEK